MISVLIAGILVIAFPLLIVGSDDCPCIDSASNPIVPIATCRINEQDIANTGLLFNEACYPLTYGRSICDAHDLKVNPLCNSSNPDLPEYCHDEWCYVDFEKCKRSDKMMRKSDYYPGSNDIFYSYSTCGSTEYNWVDFSTTVILKGKELTVTIPGMWSPAHYKETAAGEISTNSTGVEYYDDSVLWQGWIIDYLHEIVRLSGIAGLNFTYRTRGVDKLMPSSPWSASVLDVGSEVSDLSASSYWVTSDRLLQTAFTMPMYMDNIYIWAKKPTIDNTWKYNASKILKPFEIKLWVIVISMIAIVGCLNVWFARPEGMYNVWYSAFRDEKWKKASLTSRVKITLRVVFESFVAQAHFLFGGGVSMDFDGTASQNILSFGYAFMVLILIATYTANLAAFLTLSGVKDYISTIEEAIAQGASLCAHPVLRTDLHLAWPKANFVFSAAGKDPMESMLDNFEAELCTAIVSGYTDIRNELKMMKRVCDLELVRTGAPVLGKPIAFPINTKYMAAISHLIFRAQEQGIDYTDFLAKSQPPLVCSMEISKKREGLLAMNPSNFALPIIVLIFCAIISVTIHLTQSHHEKIRKALKKTFLQYRSASRKTNTKSDKDLLEIIENNDREINIPSADLSDDTNGVVINIAEILPAIEDLQANKIEIMRSLHLYQQNLMEAIIEGKKDN